MSTEHIAITHTKADNKFRDLLFSSLRTFDLEAQTHRKKRFSGITEGVLSALAARIIGVAVTVLSVPLTVGYLGAERYGLWVTIGSTLAWLQFADLGLGNGITNVVSRSLGNGRADEARRQISTSFFLILAVSLLIGALVAIAWPHIAWQNIFGVRNPTARAETPAAVALALIFTLLQFPLSVVNKVLLALQEGKRANYWSVLANLAGLIALFLITHAQGGLVWLVLAVSGVGFVVSFASGVWLFRFYRPDLCPRLQLITFDGTKELRSVSAQFLILQLMALVVFQTDNILIAHFLGASKVSSYSIAYKLFGYTFLLQNILFSYLWAGYSDALARKDFEWVNRAFLRNLGFSVASTLALTVPLLIFAKSIIRLWAGESVVPSLGLCCWMAAWSVINSFTSPIACLFSAASHLKAQMIYGALATIANVAFSLALIQRWGTSGAIAGTVLSYLVFICVPCAFDAARLLNRYSHEV